MQGKWNLDTMGIMAVAKKVTKTHRFFVEDLERMYRLLKPRETETHFIETALAAEFDRREKPRHPRGMSSLAAFGDEE